MAKTNAEKQADFKARMRKAGFQLVALWVHRNDKAELVALARKLKEKRKG